MNIIFKFLGFKESEKEEVKLERNLSLIKLLEKKYKVFLLTSYVVNDSIKIEIIRFNDIFDNAGCITSTAYTYGIYEKLCIDGDCVEKFTFIPNPNKPNKEDGREEYKVDSLETAVKYVSDYLKNKAELEKEKEEELKLKEIEKIKTLPELKM
jgi:hypothetical protein